MDFLSFLFLYLHQLLPLVAAVAETPFWHVLLRKAVGGRRVGTAFDEVRSSNSF